MFIRCSAPFLQKCTFLLPVGWHQAGSHVSVHACHFVRNLHSPSPDTSAHKRIVFLGTPSFAALVLKGLLHEARATSRFQISAVVTRSSGDLPRYHDGSSKRHAASPVERTARDFGLDSQHILCPRNAKEEWFLSHLEHLAPDLCITAAYGAILPQRFLDIPPCGTVNIHPSLLPLYRGPAPVQRALQDGVTHTGVTLAYTVLQCDAGPVLEQRTVDVHPNARTPELTDKLFTLGTQMLLRRMGDILSGRGFTMAVPQNESKATHAPKLTRAEALMDLSQDAFMLHNKVRAFAGWPGTRAVLLLEDTSAGTKQPIDITVLQTRALLGNPAQQHDPCQPCFLDGQLLIPCGQGTLLSVTQMKVHLPGTRSNKVCRTPAELQLALGSRHLLLPEPAAGACHR